jgi:hypothetical protein
MFTLIIIAAVVLAVAVGTFTLIRSRAPRLREEPLGNPHPDLAEPVVRADSRHRDTPAGADLDRRSGRHDD